MTFRPAALALLSLALARPALADPAAPDAEATPPSGRVLAGHVFQPSAIVSGALVTTSYGSYLLLAGGSTSTDFQIGDRHFKGDFSYAGIGAVLGYEYAFTPWLSARFTLSESMYSGIDGPSAVAIGTSLQGSASVGATASMPVGETLRVGVLLDVGSAPGFALTIGNGLRDVIESCQAGDCSLENTESVFELQNAKLVQPALAANWVPWRPLGLTASATYVYASQKVNDGTVTGSAARLGGAADLDLKPLWGVPVGLQLTTQWTAPFSGEGIQHVFDLGGGVFYTGREHLSLGLQLAMRRFKVQEDLPVSWKTGLATIGLRYYW